MVEKMDTGLLKNAPLKEVILELHWELEYIPEQNIQIDKGFEEAAINFRSACQQDFKEVEILKPPSIPSIAFNHIVTHRFFKQKRQHPLYQFGPGVFTINDNNKNYKWEDFRALVLSGLKCLRGSYSKSLVLSKVELRYIDSVSVSTLGDDNKFQFLKTHLNVNAEGNKFAQGELTDINFTKRFLINDDTYLNIMIATGLDSQTKAESIIWHTYINNKRRIDWEELSVWINNAHAIASDTFKKILSNELYKHFS
jgi:uncharacterized protein (TIGR04255 family)